MKRLFFLCLFMPAFFVASTQCTTPINTFPFNEGFETSNGGWTPGGSQSDWAWGTPSKPVITAAASGTKCWITGGLTNSNYNSGENSWIQSPCFDLTSLVTPRIEFKVFWETERNFDGANLQYSTDGLTWTVVGSTVNDTCIKQNWYNTGSINFLGAKPGWSGNIQTGGGSCVNGGGSGSWIVARHDISTLGGQSTVLFRFAFAAGTTCNAFDGFAIDDINISEAPLNDYSDFTYTCLGNNTVSFHGVSPGCISTPLWEFGDPTSPNNLSNLNDPVHIFTAPGSYTVTLRNNIVTPGQPVTIIKNITIPGLSVTISDSIDCSGGTGRITALVTGTASAISYIWNSNPVQTTQTATNLRAGNYSVTISAPGICTTSQSITLTEASAILVSPVIEHAACNNNNGKIVISVNGGTAPYQYSWSNGGSSRSVINLAPGNYSVQIIDVNGCTGLAGPLVVNNINKIIAVSLGKDTGICPGQQLVLDPGNFTSYKWQDNSTARTFSVLNTGTYTVEVTDSSGCKGNDAINVIVDCSDISFPSGFTPGADGKNDLFGPLGNISILQNYSLTIYNRWGQQVFNSIDPSKKWDGSVKGKNTDTGIFLWYALYELNGMKRVKKGTITLIR